MNIFLTIIITLVIYFVLTYLLKKIDEIATKNNKDKTLSKIIAVISWVLIIGVIISPLLLSFVDRVLGAFGFGLAFGCIGGAVFFSSLKDLNLDTYDDKIGILIPGIFSIMGLIIMIISAIIYIEPNTLKTMLYIVIPLFLLFSFPGVGIAMLITSFIGKSTNNTVSLFMGLMFTVIGSIGLILFFTSYIPGVLK